MLKNTSLRHCQYLHIDMDNTEVCNFCETKDKFNSQEKLSQELYLQEMQRLNCVSQIKHNA